MEIVTVPVERDLLGEGPVWDDRRQALYWSDQLGRKVRRYTPATGEYREWVVPKPLGCIALTDADWLLIALADGFYQLDLATGEAACIAKVPQLRAGVRLNDGRCDRSGRLVSGSVVTDGGGPDGMIYRLFPDGETEVIRDGMTIVNAICFSPTGDRLYYTDSRAGVILVRDYDPASRRLGVERPFADTRPYGGGPDGATVDAEGGVWIAQILNGQILRFRSDGSFDCCIKTPVPHVSSLSFGGADLDVLYVTSVRETGMLIKSDHPQAGALFSITGLGVRGAPEGRFASEAKRPAINEDRLGGGE